ncbi:DUF3549 family protein [Vibrio sp. CAIM 722]|uniref:DUF3549 family protein n=1 Tax=Vibrio eleionomae TaxID=2653505 RepID=A0A7X4LKW1_9VIBR|nr:DUF3549 family protein [Vibrio eleionomae]MZI93507.1 DUF3549 family protein [Vibrio eleionomae]
MDNIATLSQLLQTSGNHYKVFDLGRRIQVIPNEQFHQVEQGSQPYPYPVQRSAQIAIAYWNEANQPWIWFLKFELDERGLLQQSHVTQFIQYVLEAMGSRLTNELSEEQQQKLTNNPYTFKPHEDKMALFHSLIRSHLALPCSQYYEHAQHYFKGGLGWDNWQTVGLQGITDICTHIGQEQNGVLLRKAIAHLPTQPLYALLGALEHIDLPEKLADRIVEMANKEIVSDKPDLFLLSALVRALAGAPEKHLTDIVDKLLSSEQLSHQEILIGIAGRSWHVLADSGRAQRFLLRLAQTGNQALFNQLFADLVMLPQLRMVILPLLHASPSPELTQALMELQRNTKG